MSEQVAIEIKDLVKSFSGRTVLNKVNLKIYKGQVTVIMGGSGCGKSTLLRHIIGSHTPDSGSIFINNEDITPLSDAAFDKIRKRFGMVFHNAALFDSMNVDRMQPQFYRRAHAGKAQWFKIDGCGAPTRCHRLPGYEAGA